MGRTPPADWSSAWEELTGYLTEADHDQAPLTAAEILGYMAELKQRYVTAPFLVWMRDLGR